MAESKQSVRVMFACSGVGILNRGIESFFREAFDGLKNSDGLQCHLLKGAGETRPDETVVWNLRRTGRAARWLGKLTGRNGYVTEQWSSFLPVAHQIRRFKPHVMFYSDSNLGFLLYWFRNQIGVPYRLLYSNGGPCHPPFIRRDFVHQVAPFYLEEALRAGEPPEKHFMVPYGINVSVAPVLNPGAKHELRAKLGLPPERKIVLSVGWIAREHKRMDYLIQEVVRLPEPRPFLLLLGAIDRNSEELVAMAQRLLGPNSFAARSVPYEQVSDFYRAADVFVLCSLQEGFGRAFLEAMSFGLPVIAHRHPVIEYVLGEEGIFADLTQPTGLADLLSFVLTEQLEEQTMLRRWEAVRSRFSWRVLARSYREMFLAAASRPVPARPSGT